MDWAADPLSPAVDFEAPVIVSHNITLDIESQGTVSNVNAVLVVCRSNMYVNVNLHLFTAM